jgi:shikimate dehydrogenase
MRELYGLIGKSLGHSFSKTYFTEKFEQLGIPAQYQNFELPSIAGLRDFVLLHPELRGFNVTIPYKTEIIPYLDEVEETAMKVGAVNTVQIDGGRLLGFNTDVIGFRDSLTNFYLAPPGGAALVLGTGGASKAIVYALQHYFPFDAIHLVSRTAQAGSMDYETLHDKGFHDYNLIINTTPVGMHPHENEELPLPWRTLRKSQYLYDLIYNPERTTFLQHGARHGCRIQNGMDMLTRQADAAWEIWGE